MEGHRICGFQRAKVRIEHVDLYHMNDREEFVILVNAKDEPQGLMGKMLAHRNGSLHRAFSVFLFNDQGETLLQQRAEGKYHSPMLWTNSCCSHPREGETVLDAANRRLGEELGIDEKDVHGLKKLFHFQYHASFDDGLVEHELDHVLTAKFQGDTPFNHDEVHALAWRSIADIQSDMEANPSDFTAWFQIIFKEYLNHLIT